MKFVDSIKIKVKAGNGGKGLLSFFQDWQQKKPKADGGNGGKGSDIIFVSSDSINSLIDFKTNQFIHAENGEGGNKNKRNGKNAEPLKIKVPVGSIIFTSDKKNVIFNFSKPNQEFIIVKGGNGGRGNAFFLSNKNKFGKKSESGTLGEYRNIIIELKILADIGLIGLPNAGKSSILKVLTNAKPQIANYEFTTLSPNLGILNKDSKKLVIADLPGIIEGAHMNKGLGNKFLKHSERCKMLIHVVDLNLESIDEFHKKYNLIKNELKKYSEVLYNLPILIVGTKIDIEQAKKIDNQMENIYDEKIFFSISSKEKINIDGLIIKIFEFYEKNKETKTVLEKRLENEYENGFLIEYLPYSEIRLRKIKNGIWELSGQLFDNLLKKNDIDTKEGLEKINDFFEKKEIKECFKIEGLKNKDVVILNNKYFDWRD